ncbi:MAG: 16S rRNA (guanine(527)-N(7))-methyltransferase RsmG [Cyanobacterium sp.]
MKLPDFNDIWQKTTNWQPNPHQQLLFDQLYSKIIETNKYLNLTRITTPEEFWEKNLWDSLAPLMAYDLNNKKIIDIGTGGGFPGIPSAIAFPLGQFTLMDSTTKKINFITQVSQDLNLTNITTLVDRAERIGQEKSYRNQFDFALIRAVAETSVCLEYTLPLLKKDGIAILYRGNWTMEEEEKTKKVAKILGGNIEKIINQNTPLNDNIRHCIYIKKIDKTPKQYPREVGKPVKQPL